MTFHDWIFTITPPNSAVNGAWKAPHIITLILSILTIIVLAIVFRNKSEKSRIIVIRILIYLILFFEIARRIVNMIKGQETLNAVLYTLLPRPWCAISCWILIISMFANKRFLYNFASMSALLNAIIFFAYPEAGFTNKYILFDHLYSIATHVLLLITSITLITLKFTDFKYKNPTFKQGAFKELICLIIVYAYAFFEIYVLNIASDPLYFMPNGDVAKVLGNMSYGIYLPLYIIFLVIYFNAFYVIPIITNKIKNKKFK